MARPPQFERFPEPTRDRSAVKAALKGLTPGDRAYLLTWLLLYFDDRGELYSRQVRMRRKRIVLDGVDYWLVSVQTPSRSKH